jgi:hypothetical protein
MPIPFGTATANAPYYAKPCNERLASIPEALMKLAEGGYTWEDSYVAGKPNYALTLMDYPNIYSFIHTHDLNRDAVRKVLSDAALMVHRKAFTEEEIDLLLERDGTLYPVEVKQSANPSRSDIRNFSALDPVSARDLPPELEAFRRDVGLGTVVCMNPEALPITKDARSFPVWAI